MTYYLIKEDVFMALTGDITDCTIEEFIARLRNKLSKLPSFAVTTNEDGISRQAVNTLVDELARAISDERCCISRGRSTGRIMQDILDLPPVTPKEKTGKWIDTNNYYQRWKCSECGCHTRDTEPNFCPNCGAKMVEIQES